MPKPDLIYRNQPLAGALCVLGASLAVSLVGTLVKITSASLPNEMVVFLRNIATLLFILPGLYFSRPRVGIRTGCFGLHLLRSLAGLGAMYCFFYAIGHLRLAEAFLLLATGPLFIPVIAAVWLGEAVPWKTRSAILLGFLGIVLILKPGIGIVHPAAVVGLGAGFFSALAMVTIRRMSTTEPALRTVFWFTLLAAVASSVPLSWTWQKPTTDLLSLFLAMGLCAVIAQTLLTKGYSLAPSARLGPFTYGNVVFSTLIGWLFWGEKIDALTGVGALLICICGIVAAYQTNSS
jgi:drug/metabolite transporter (DMT)-like permease